MDQTRVKVRNGISSDAALLAELGARTFYDTFAADNTPENMTVFLTAMTWLCVFLA